MQAPTSSVDRGAWFRDRGMDVAALAIIFIVTTWASIPALTSGDRLNLNGDYYQYLSRYEAVRKSLVEYGTLPLRSHWFGGGYPTIADPEDPTLNPLVILSVAFGTVRGLKVMSYLAILCAGLGTYVFARSMLRYTRWGALFSGLVYGVSLFVPLRVESGNPNEVYAAFLPLCLLLVGLAAQGRRYAVPALVCLFVTMLSDGKLTTLMAMFYLGVVCALDLLPWQSAFPAVRRAPEDVGAPRQNHRPLKVLLLSVGLAALVDMPRILPVQELFNTHGGIQQLLAAHPKTYQPDRIPAYSFRRLWREAINAGEEPGMVTVGWIPVVLGGVALIARPRLMFGWGIGLGLFAWLAMAHRAPIDLLRLLWHLPVFEAIYQPEKYFSFQIVFAIAILSGRAISMLHHLRPQWERVAATALIAGMLVTLSPENRTIQEDTYGFDVAREQLPIESGFFQIQSQTFGEGRREPPRALAYHNLRANIGTIDWYTGIPIPASAVPRYFVGLDNRYIENPAYKGEAYFANPSGGRLTAAPVFTPNEIVLNVEVNEPTTLVVNQNFSVDWAPDIGQLNSRDGLIGVALDRAGSYTVHLRYFPRAFLAGLVIMLATLAVCAVVFWADRTGRLLRWSNNASPPLRIGSRAMLWLVG